VIFTKALSTLLYLYLPASKFQIMFPLANPFYVVVQQPFFSSQGDSKYGEYLGSIKHKTLLFKDFYDFLWGE